jgi:hypothetical protein
MERVHGVRRVSRVPVVGQELVVVPVVVVPVVVVPVVVVPVVVVPVVVEILRTLDLS